MSNSMIAAPRPAAQKATKEERRKKKQRQFNENIKAITDMSVLMTPDEAKDFRGIKTI